MRTAIIGLTATLALSSCALFQPRDDDPLVISDRGNPVPVTRPGEPVQRGSYPAGYIGQCHDALPDARIIYPNGWQERDAPSKSAAMAQDELLGAAPAGATRSRDMADRNAQPSDLPHPDYPEAALSAQKEGACQLMFDVNSRGVPYEFLAACTDSMFADPAIRAMAKTRFEPKRKADGSPTSRYGVVYPINFCFAEPRG